MQQKTVLILLRLAESLDQRRLFAFSNRIDTLLYKFAQGKGDLSLPKSRTTPKGRNVGDVFDLTRSPRPKKFKSKTRTPFGKNIPIRDEQLIGMVPDTVWRQIIEYLNPGHQGGAAFDTVRHFGKKEKELQASIDKKDIEILDLEKEVEALDKETKSRSFDLLSKDERGKKQHALQKVRKELSKAEEEREKLPRTLPKREAQQLRAARRSLKDEVSKYFGEVQQGVFDILPLNVTKEEETLSTPTSFKDPRTKEMFKASAQLTYMLFFIYTELKETDADVSIWPDKLVQALRNNKRAFTNKWNTELRQKLSRYHESKYKDVDRPEEMSDKEDALYDRLASKLLHIWYENIPLSGSEAWKAIDLQLRDENSDPFQRMGYLSKLFSKARKLKTDPRSGNRVWEANPSIEGIQTIASIVTEMIEANRTLGSSTWTVERLDEDIAELKGKSRGVLLSPVDYKYEIARLDVDVDYGGQKGRGRSGRTPQNEIEDYDKFKQIKPQRLALWKIIVDLERQRNAIDDARTKADINAEIRRYDGEDTQLRNMAKAIQDFQEQRKRAWNPDKKRELIEKEWDKKRQLKNKIRHVDLIVKEYRGHTPATLPKPEDIMEVDVIEEDVPPMPAAQANPVLTIMKALQQRLMGILSRYRGERPPEALEELAEINEALDMLYFEIRDDAKQKTEFFEGLKKYKELWNLKTKKL